MGLVAKNPREEQLQQEQMGVGDLVGEPPAYATGTVHHDAVAPDGTVVHHSQTFDAGRLVDWRIDDEPGPWALVRPGPPELRCPPGPASGEDLAAVGVRLGDEVVPLPPADDLPRSIDGLPEVPDATARLRYGLMATPVGDVVVDVRYVDGQRVSCTVVTEWAETVPAGEPAHDAPEMAVAMTWRNYLAMRTGEKTALEAIEDGGDVGGTRWTMLLLLHGLVQSEGYVAFHRGLARMPDELTWWAEAARFVPGDAAPRGAGH